MKKYFYIIFGLSLLLNAHSVNAQAVIDSVKLLPSKPVRNDTVRIALYTHTTSVSTEIHLTQAINNNDIYIESCYDISGSSANTYYEDTLTIGELKEGTYNVYVTCYRSLGPQCDYLDTAKDTLTFVVESPVSIPTFNPTSFTIYPSPANDVLHINSPSGATIQNSSIYDVCGALLRQYPNNKKSLDISGIPAGMYFLYIDTDKGRVVKRFIKE